MLRTRPVLRHHSAEFIDILDGKILEKNLPDTSNIVDSYTECLVRFIHKVKHSTGKGGDKMAKSISVNEILKQAKAAQDAYDAAVEQRKNVRKVARTLADAGLLDEDDVAKVEEIFPARKVKEAEAEATPPAE